MWYAVQLVLYQLGRVLVYTFLGLLVGVIGSSITLFTNQETLSLFVGILLIAFTLIYFSGRYFNYIERFQALLISPISRLMGRIYSLPFWGFFAGMLNGLIPCGMVYLALATALNSSSVKNQQVLCSCLVLVPLR